MREPPRRVLFLTYYFPPSGGPGVQRALKFTKYFPEFGWQPTILTVRPENASYPDLDETLAREIPPDVRVDRTKAWDPYSAYARLLGKSKGEMVGVGFGSEETWKQRLAKQVRANVFLPDARVGWVPFAVRRGSTLLNEQPHDAILTTGPPHSTHLAGLLLARRFKLPWVADFRDPWTDIDFAHQLPKTVLAEKADARMERAVLRNASAVTVVTPTWMRDLERRAPGNYQVIWNGFDPADFADQPVERPDTFYITHVGSLNAARNPVALWKALRNLDAPELRVRLIGSVDPSALESAREQGVAGLVETAPYVPHDEAVREMRRSGLLLLLINDAPNQMGIVPGKLYEYMASGRPILAIGPSGGDSASVLESASAGRMFGFENSAGIRAFIDRHYRAWRAGEPMDGADPQSIASFSRRSQTGEMAQLLNTLIQ